MAEPAREYGPGCPGCTPALISNRMARFPEAYPTCRACLEHGALYHAEKQKMRAREDVEMQDQRGDSAQG